ncbi:MAG: hypothetical protein KAR05_10410 [Candidatus Omnitrophica bacterium]|nr:hypothetical protein [Candidatus Omnitrophota bacterium]
MSGKYDFKKEWPKIKKQLMQYSKDALELAKKGEKELVRVSKKGKRHLDMTALNLKREHLYHLIGKEYVKAKCPGPQTPKINQLIQDLNKIEEDMKVLRSAGKPERKVKKTPAKKKTRKRVTKS